MKKVFPAVTVMLLLSDCVANQKPVPANLTPATPVAAVAPAASASVKASQTRDYASRLMQCRKKLDALQTYNIAQHQRFKAEFEKQPGN